jgi:hypothetical protein
VLDHTVNNIQLNISEHLDDQASKKVDLSVGKINQFAGKQANTVIEILKIFLFDAEFLFLAAMLACSIYGVNHHAWLAPTLAIPVKENSTLLYVIASTTGHASQLLVTIVLGLIILYWYSVVAFFNWNGGRFYFEGVPMECDTLYNCFRVMGDYGFATFPFWEEEQPIPEKAILWNFSYVLLVNLVLTAIISGIIIDSFSEMRLAEEHRKHEKNNVCFICNIEREDFERLGIDFKNHIKRYHNMWNYIFKKI